MDANNSDVEFFDLISRVQERRLEGQRASGPGVTRILLSKRDLLVIRRAREKDLKAYAKRLKLEKRKARSARPDGVANGKQKRKRGPVADPNGATEQHLAMRQLPQLPSLRNILQVEPFYVGDVSRGEANTMLDRCIDGSYLVRRSNEAYVISVVWRENPNSVSPYTHVKVQMPNPAAKRGYGLADVDDFPTLEALCRHYQV